MLFIVKFMKSMLWFSLNVLSYLCLVLFILLSGLDYFSAVTLTNLASIFIEVLHVLILLQ